VSPRDQGQRGDGAGVAGGLGPVRDGAREEEERVEQELSRRRRMRALAARCSFPATAGVKDDGTSGEDTGAGADGAEDIGAGPVV
jgi:hypothetical protein